MRLTCRVAAAFLLTIFWSAQALSQPQPPSEQPAPPAAPTDEPAAADQPEAPAPGVQPPADVQPSAPAPAPRAPAITPPPAERDARDQAPDARAPRVNIAGEVAASPDQVFAEDWWHTARPLLELHGYYRFRSELFHNFALGRVDPASTALWPQPPGNSYTEFSDGTITPRTVPFCGDASNPGTEGCKNKMQAGANMRFRLNPELHISDNVRILSQIDMLDNVVLGSTPTGYANAPAAGGGYARAGVSGYTPLGALTNSIDTPTAGVNGFQDSIKVRRVWGEYLTPVGQLRFGRMPQHWGLGILANSGDGYDSDYQSTVDRIMFVTGIKSADLYAAGAWDFANEGPTSESLTDSEGQPYDLSQVDDVHQYALMLMRRRNPALQKLELSRGKVVVNGGLYFLYRHQMLAADASTLPLGATTDQVRDSYVRREFRSYTPDLWLQVLYEKLRFEMEAVMVRGSMDNTQTTPGAYDYDNPNDPDKNGWDIRQYAVATETEYKTVEDRLRLNFGFGWASGDADVLGPGVGGLTPGNQNTPGFSGLPSQGTDRTISTFRFHPNYRVDQILFRHILNRVQGAYYFRPAVDYDFTRQPNGQRFGGGAAVIWSRASEFVQAPGHKRDLGVEIDLSLYFQSKDGVLNDDPEKMGGFFTMVQYGVLFPLGGLGYMSGEVDQAADQNLDLDTSAAHLLRWYAGIFF